MKKSLTLLVIMSFALLMLSGCNEKKNEPASPDTPETPSTPDTPSGDETGDEFVTDICGNKYKCVKIGDQVWIAENLRCNKYDTESGRKDAEITIYSSHKLKPYTYDPYCVDASDEANWGNQNFVTEELSQQKAKLGYLYNWAAAVCFESAAAAKEQDKYFEDSRQGICPNGWHVPAVTEWKTLVDNCTPLPYSRLKSKSGWYNGINGTDEFEFAILPAGLGEGSVVRRVGADAYFWTATATTSTDANYRHWPYDAEIIHINEYNKREAFSVRCVKN